MDYSIWKCSLSHWMLFGFNFTLCNIRNETSAFFLFLNCLFIYACPLVFSFSELLCTRTVPCSQLRIGPWLVSQYENIYFLVGQVSWSTYWYSYVWCQLCYTVIIDFFLYVLFNISFGIWEVCNFVLVVSFFVSVFYIAFNSLFSYLTFYCQVCWF